MKLVKYGLIGLYEMTKLFLNQMMYYKNILIEKFQLKKVNKNSNTNFINGLIN